MEISVAFATDQRNVADWPLSTELGSATKVSIRGSAGFAGGGGSTLVTVTGCGGGGGGAAATFFLHPAADKSSTAANAVAPSVSLLIRILLTGLLKPKVSRTTSFSLALSPTQAGYYFLA